MVRGQPLPDVDVQLNKTGQLTMRIEGARVFIDTFDDEGGKESSGVYTQAKTWSWRQYVPDGRIEHLGGLDANRQRFEQTSTSFIVFACMMQSRCHAEYRVGHSFLSSLSFGSLSACFLASLAVAAFVSAFIF